MFHVNLYQIMVHSLQVMNLLTLPKNVGFKHITSSPHYPRSNGLAESSVKGVKGLMKKGLDRQEDWHQSLMIYRSAPLQNGLYPAIAFAEVKI